MKPNRQDSIITKYASVINENKEKRKARGEWYENEPEELIFDPDCENDYDENGHLPPWEYSNLISGFCVQDIFGGDWSSVERLLCVRPVDYIYKDTDHYEQVVYFREIDIVRVLGILTALAKSNIITTLRPQYQTIGGNLVYSGEDIMNLLDIKEERLRKFREQGYLGYTKYPGSDKIWYKKEDLEAFLNNPTARHEPWR